MATNTGLDPSQAFIEKQQAKRAAGGFNQPATPQTAAGGTVSASVTPLTSTVNNPTPQPVQPANQAQIDKRNAGAFGTLPADQGLSSTGQVVDPTKNFMYTQTKQLGETISGQDQQPATPAQPKLDTIAKPAILKTDEKGNPIIDYNTSTGRENDISTNVSNITAQNPGLLTKREDFDGAFGYATADAGKKAILDSFFNSHQPTPDNVFQAIMSGQTVNPTTPGYKEAKARAEKYQRFAGYDVNQFATSLKEGDLLPGTQTYNDLVKDPAVKIKLEKANALNTINGDKVDTTKVVEKTMNDIMENSPLGKAMKDGFISGAEANELTTTPEITAKQAAVEQLQNDVTSKQNLYDNIRTETERELQGKDITNTAKEALIANRQRDLLGPLNLAIGLYNNSLGSLTEMKKQAADLFSTNIGLYKDQKAAQVLAQQRAEDRANKLSDTKDQRDYETKKFKLEQAYANPDINSNNPEIARIAAKNAVDEQLKFARENGIPMVRSDSGKIISDAREYAQSNGVSLSEALQETFTKPFTSKPEYKQALANIQAGKAQKTTYDIKEITDSSGKKISVKMDSAGNITPIFAPGTIGATGDLRGYANQFPNEASLKNNNPAGITYNSTFANTLTNAGIQFTKGTDRPAAEGGSYFSFPNIEEGFKAYNLLWSSPTYQNLSVGDALKRWGTDALPGVDMNKKVSDLTDSEKRNLQMSQIKKESPGMYKVLTSQTGTDTAVSSDAQNYFDLIQKGTTSYDDVFKKIGGTKTGQATINDLNKLIVSKGGVIPALPNSPQVKQIDTSIKKLQGLVDDPDAIENISGFFQTSPWDALTGKNADTLADIKYILNEKVLQNLIDAKANGATFGALSDAELNLLKDSSSALSAMTRKDSDGNIIGFTGSEAKVKEEIKNILDLYKEKRDKMVNPGVTIPQGGTQTAYTPTAPATAQTGVGTVLSATGKNGVNYTLKINP